MNAEATVLPGAFVVEKLSCDGDYAITSEVPFTEKEIGQLTQKEVGNLGEKLTSLFFESLGYRLLGRNMHLHMGEIDVFAFDEPYHVLCEVKSRVYEGRGDVPVPELAITEAKMNRYRTMAKVLYTLDPTIELLRFDAVGLLITSNCEASLRYFPSAWGMGIWS